MEGFTGTEILSLLSRGEPILKDNGMLVIETFIPIKFNPEEKYLVPKSVVQAKETFSASELCFIIVAFNAERRYTLTSLESVAALKIASQNMMLYDDKENLGWEQKHKEGIGNIAALISRLNFAVYEMKKVARGYSELPQWDVSTTDDDDFVKERHIDTRNTRYGQRRFRNRTPPYARSRSNAPRRPNPPHMTPPPGGRNPGANNLDKNINNQETVRPWAEPGPSTGRIPESAIEERKEHANFLSQVHATFVRNDLQEVSESENTDDANVRRREEAEYSRENSERESDTNSGSDNDGRLLSAPLVSSF